VVASRIDPITARFGDIPAFAEITV